MKLDNQTIKSALLKGNYLAEESIREAEEFAKSHGTTLSEALLSLNLLKKEYLGQALAEEFGMAYAGAQTYDPSAEQILRIPEPIARKYKVAFLTEERDRILVAVSDPNSPGFPRLKNFFPRKKLFFFFLFRKILRSFFPITEDR